MDHTGKDDRLMLAMSTTPRNHADSHFILAQLVIGFLKSSLVQLASAELRVAAAQLASGQQAAALEGPPVLAAFGDAVPVPHGQRLSTGNTSQRPVSIRCKAMHTGILDKSFKAPNCQLRQV